MFVLTSPEASKVVFPVIFTPTNSSTLESKVNRACQDRSLPRGVNLTMGGINHHLICKLHKEEGVIKKAELKRDDVKKMHDLFESLDIQTALFAPEVSIQMQALKMGALHSRAFLMYNIMLICANRRSEVVDTINLEQNEIERIGAFFCRVRTMLRLNVKKPGWPTNKILFGTFLIYWASFKNETYGLIIPDQIDKDELISRCKYVYRDKRNLDKNDEDKYIRLQSLAAAIYFLCEFGHLHSHELSKLEKQLLNLYSSKVTTDGLKDVYEEFSKYYKAGGLLELRLEEVMSEWTDLRDEYYQFKQENRLGEEFPRLAPNPQLFFKSNAFFGIIFKSLLNDEAKFIEKKSFEKILNEWLEVYLDFSCLEEVFKALADPNFIRGSTITISELKRQSLEDFSSIRIHSIERAYYESLIKVILNISDQINIREDVKERIAHIAELADITDHEKAKEQAFEVVDNLLNNFFIRQFGVFSTIQKDLKACTHWLELRSVMRHPDSKIEEKAYDLLNKAVDSHLVCSKELENFKNACDLYRVMKTFVAISRRAQDGHQVQKNLKFDNSNIFMRAFFMYDKIKKMLTDPKNLLPEGLDAEKLLFGAFLIYNESKKREPSEALNIPNFILDDFLNLCENVYVNVCNKDLDDLSYLDIQIMSVSIYFLFESGRLDKLSQTEAFLKKFVLSEGFAEFCENLANYKLLYPFLNDKGKSLTSKISTIVSFWEEEEFLKMHSFIFVRTGIFLQQVLDDLNEGLFNQILASRIKSKLSELLKLFIERSNIDEHLKLEDSESSQKLSIDELNKLSDKNLEKINLKEIARPYFTSILVTLLHLSKHVELDNAIKIKLLEIATKAGVIQYSAIDDNQRNLLDEAIQSGSLTQNL